MALMGKLGLPRNIETVEGPTNGQARIGVTFKPGALMLRRAGSTLLEVPLSASPIADAEIVGFYDSRCELISGSNDDGNGGALDLDDKPILIIAKSGQVGWFATGTGANEILIEHQGLPCYAYDDDTLYLTNNGGTLPFAGFVADVRADGRVRLLNTALTRAMRGLFAEGGAGVAGVTQSSTARAVVTSLAANTVVDGVMTADANGAIGAQDGVTLAVGDEVFIPEGTTNLDNAYEAGLYTVTALGAVGAKFVLTRPASYAHDAVIAQATDIKIAEGTLYGGSTWRTFAAKGAIVGTDAPLAYPDCVLQQVTLVSGTKTISNVPIRSTSKVVMSPTLIGGTPAATTTNYEKKLTSGVTAGALGTASIIIEAQSVAGTIVGTDVSVLNVAIRNW